MRCRRGRARWPGDFVALDRQEQVDQLLAEQIPQGGVLLSTSRAASSRVRIAAGHSIAIGEPLSRRWRLDAIA